MARWKFWDWVAYCCLGIAALGLAAGAALKEDPAMFERLPAVFTSPKWAYAPIILFALGSFILAVRFAGPLVLRTSIPGSHVSDISERVFVQETPEYLVSLGKGMTSVQREQATAIYIGKWLKVSAPIKNVSNLTSQMVVMAELGDAAEFHDFQMFFEPKWSPRLSLLRRGQTISAIGKIYTITGMDIVLRNCELTDEATQISP